MYVMDFVSHRGITLILIGRSAIQRACLFGVYLFIPFGLGAKSQSFSSVAPPRKKKLVTIFSQGHGWGPQKPMFY